MRDGLVAAAATLLAMAAQPALAQGASIADLRAEMTRNYDTALAATRDRGVIAADDSRYVWASEAKVACGIAIGYLKTRTVDDETIARCRSFTGLMTNAPAPAPAPAADPLPPPPPPPTGDALPPPPPPATTAACPVALPAEVHFDWASATPLPESSAIIESIATSAAACGVRAVTVVGHADRSGGEGFNQRLSRRRADAVAAALAAEGMARGAIQVRAVGERDPAVPTADGVREPANRRVAISRNER
ncbi:OmpA family protein [Sphingomonas adhaesiva]|uniref:OmpA family protein n=1 Tax=Sphingomonas adhaesiva TaxID=28212 RepID=UPI002FF6B9D9